MNTFTTDFERSAMPITALVSATADVRMWASAGFGAAAAYGQSCQGIELIAKRAATGRGIAEQTTGTLHPSQRLGRLLT